MSKLHAMIGQLALLAAKTTTSNLRTARSMKFLGANISTLMNYGGAIQYVDAAKMAGSFAKQAFPNAGPGITPDAQLAAVKADGWPSEDFVTIPFLVGNYYPYMSGTYECSYTGSSMVSGLRVNETNCTAPIRNHRYVGNNTYRFQIVYDGTNPGVSPTTGLQNNAYFQIYFTGIPADFSSFKMIRPGYAWDTTQVFTTEWLNSIKEYSCLRLMDNMRASAAYRPGFDSDAQTTWASRWTGTSTIAGQIYYRHSLEAMVETAVQTGKDIWVCLPHRATVDYAVNAMSMLVNNIPSSQKIYVELSNEIWNFSYAYSPQYAYVRQQMRTQLGVLGGNSQGGTTPDITSASINIGVCTVNFTNPHNLTTGQSIKVSIGSPSVIGLFTVTVTSPTQITFPVSASNAAISVSGYGSIVIVTNLTDDITYDFMPGTSGDNYWFSCLNETVWAYRWVAKRLLTFKQAADAVLPAGYLKNRICFVLAGQWVDPATIALVLGYLSDNYPDYQNWLEAISGAPYISTTNVASAKTPDQLIDEMVVQNTNNRSRYYQWLNNAKYYGVKFIPYEMGTDLSVASTANKSAAAQASASARMRGVTYDMIRNSFEQFTDGAMLYVEGVFPEIDINGKVVGSGNFDLRQQITDTEVNNPRVGGIYDFLGSYEPTNFSEFWTKIPSDNSYYNSDPYLYSPVCEYNRGGSYQVYSGSLNLVQATTSFAAGAKTTFSIRLYCPADGTYTFTPQLGAHFSTPSFSVLLDGVSTGITVVGSTGSTNVISQPVPNCLPFTLAVTKGWHILTFKAITAAKTYFAMRQLLIA